MFLQTSVLKCKYNICFFFGNFHNIILVVIVILIVEKAQQIPCRPPHSLE